ncbi:MAG: BON domain-containing protein [Thiobacillaceae bacterium]|jgi:osmotically-inducible protein OsmY
MRGILYLALIAALAPALNGCVAVVAAGAATAVMVADDRRKAGAYVDDEEIELRGLKRLHEAFPHAAVSVSVTSYNHNVLLTGQAPDDATKARVEEVIKGVPKVRKVYNEVAVSGVTSYTSEANDSSITTKVKTRLMDSKKGVSFNHVKVVTEAGVVYLMGLLTHAEADKAAEVAATSGGVVKVVKVIEYTD